MKMIDSNNLDFRSNFNSVIKYMAKKEDKFLSRFGLTHFHAMYIRNLYICDGMTMTELTENIGVDKANTTRVIKDLIDKQVVTKSEGERKFKLSLTELGKKIASEFKANIDKFMQKVYSNFTMEEKEQIRHLMNKLMLGVKSAMEE